MIGIIGAMEIEVETILAEMKNRGTEHFSGLSFTVGELSGVSCVVARCNPGKVNAACCAQTMIMKYSPCAVINVGVAGGVSRDVKIGDLVLANGVVQHDMDTTHLGDAPGYLSGIGLVQLPTSESINQALKEAAGELGLSGKLHFGIVATGDQFIADPAALHRIASQFHACACEMEAGSIAQICKINQIPCAVVRSISDHADEDAGVDFPQFARQSAHTAAQLLCHALPKLAVSLPL